MLEKLESEMIGADFDALEFLDGNTDAKTLHGTSFAPSYAAVSKKVSSHQCGLASMAINNPPNTVSSLRALKS